MDLLALLPDDARTKPSIAYLQLQYPRPQFGGISIATGCLVAPRLVLTAGHVVYDAFQGGSPIGITIQFGGPNGLQPEPAWADVDFPREWKAESDAAARTQTPSDVLLSSVDCGVIILTEPVSQSVPVLRCDTISDTRLAAASLNIFGFPAIPDNVPGNTTRGLPRGTAFGRNFQVVQQAELPFAEADALVLGEYRLFYPVATVGGMSGSPIYELDSAGSRIVSGIHTSFLSFQDGVGTASALRVDDRIRRLILGWITDHGGH